MKSILSFFLFLAIMTAASVEDAAHAKEPVNAYIRDSIHLFLNQFYKSANEGNERKLRGFFVSIDDKELKYYIQTSRQYKMKHFDIVDITVLSKKPLKVEVEVKEWYKQEGEIPPHGEFLFILVNNKQRGYHWKIIDLTEPGLP